VVAIGPIEVPKSIDGHFEAVPLDDDDDPDPL
jgi:hypothetical protein